MSLAYKLWKIGNVLDEEDIRKSIEVTQTFKDGIVPNYLNIDFKYDGNKISSISLFKNSIVAEKLFFTKKIGGSGTGIFYLYPDIFIVNNVPIDFEIKKNKVKISNRLFLLQNTMIKSIQKFCTTKDNEKTQSIINEIKELQICSERAKIETILTYDKKALEAEIDEKKINFILKKIKISELYLEQLIKKKENEEWNNNLLNILKDIAKLPKENYIIWLSINGKTFSELMPEVWNNWYKNPVTVNTKTELKQGYDIFSNKETEIGYKPEISVFSLDQYHDSLKYRINENLSLSLESARNIKFAWMYILDNLVFYYKGLQYVLIPNLLSNDKDIYKLIIQRFTIANKNLNIRKGKLIELRKEEEKLEKKIIKLKKSKSNFNDEELKYHNCIKQIETNDIGIFREFEEQIRNIDEHINSITLDYLFTNINRTNLSFEIKGTIEDVIPSQISKVVKLMGDLGIEDNTNLKFKNYDKIFLCDFFNRDELYFVINRSTKNNSNRIFTERLYLAKLLLTDMKIKYSDLLNRFDFNRNYDYGHKKRVKDGIKEWINYPEKFVETESKIVTFLNDLNKIKE